MCRSPHAAADERNGEHLSPPNILLSNIVDQRPALCAVLYRVASTLLSKTLTHHTNGRQNRVRREYFRAIKWNPLTCGYSPCVLCISRRLGVRHALYPRARGRKLAGARGSR